MSLLASMGGYIAGMGGTAKAALEVGSAAATVGAGALGSFKYNRENYMFDQGFRWSRYTSGYGFAIAQSKMYREDIRDLTALTCTKQDTYHIVGVIFFVINIQLIMAGRLGVHGPSPPGWLLGLYWGNSASAIMFLVLYTWLAMHASARATSGAVHLLTRSVRLPIPTPQQLDKARMTGNSFEKQRAHEVFRVPFIAPAPRGPRGLDVAGGDATGKKKADATSARRMPRWYQVDELLDAETGDAGPVTRSPVGPDELEDIGQVPDHFEVYRELQTEWVGHDVYARIGMFLYMSHWIAAIPLYSMCHVFGELRALWPAWTVTLIFSVGHYAILKLDIVPQATQAGREFALPMENIVPIIPVICVLGMSLDYSIIVPSSGWTAIIYVLSWICYIIQFLWALRTYDLTRPADTSAPSVEDQPGLPQWPAEWRLPPALAGACYIVAPPENLQGFPCIQQEMKAAKGRASLGLPKKRKLKTPPTFFAWKLMRGGVLVTIFIWLFLMVARIIEQVNGERMILKQEGRIERWPSHMQPWMAPWTRKGSSNEWAHTGGADRRLQEMERQRPSPRDLQVRETAARLASVLSPVAEALAAEEMHLAAESTAAPAALEMHPAGVAVPADFAPGFLASGGPSGGDKHLALFPRGAHRRGALLRVALDGRVTEALIPFELRGLDGLGDLLGASWGNAGILLTTSTGALAECSGLPADGAWPCNVLQVSLPMGGSSLAAATAAWTNTGTLRAAVRFTGDEGVSLLDSTVDSGVWLPLGEVRVPEAAGRSFSLSAGAAELLVPTNQGEVLSWPFGGSEPVLAAKTPKAGIEHTLVSHAACSWGNGVAQLAFPREGTPQLLLSALG